MNLPRISLLLAIGLMLSVASGYVFANHFTGHVDVTVDELSGRAQKGQQTFNDNCSACHGVNGEGTTVGPPLIHDIYNPGHHTNDAFTRAIRKGVQQHHWPYGDMPAQDQIGFVDLIDIMTFVREVQEQNGITYRRHQM